MFPSSALFKALILTQTSFSDDMNNVRPPSYEAVIESYNRLCLPLFMYEPRANFRRCSLAFESSVPEPFMCPIKPSSASTTSPDTPPSRDLTLTLQQYTFALNVSKAIVTSQLVYYRKAIDEEPFDPFQSPFSSSLLSVLERSKYMIQIVLRLSELYPAVTARHWMYWYHLSTAAWTLETFVVACPNSPLAAFATAVLSDAVTACRIGEKYYPGLSDTLDWVSRLEAQASDRVSSPLTIVSPISTSHCEDIEQLHRYHNLLQSVGCYSASDMSNVRPAQSDLSERDQSFELLGILGLTDDLPPRSVQEVLQQHHPHVRDQH